MTRTALLHIGTYKTGTSSIQELLAQAQGRGTLRPACYPIPDGGRNQSSLAALYLPHSRLPRFFRTDFPEDGPRLQRMRNRYRRAFFDEIRLADNAIVSSENLTRLRPTEIRQLRSDFEAVGFRSFVIVLYIRDPANFYLSQVQQDLKASGQVANPQTFSYPFRQVAENWEEIFPGDLIVRHYRSSPDYDVVEDFSELLLDRLGVRLPTRRVRLNASISAEGMEIMQRYRRAFWPGSDDVFTPESDRLVGLLQQLSGSVAGQSVPRLKPDVAARIRAHHRADAEFIRDRYGVDLALHEAGEAPSLPAGPLRVSDILQDLDPEVVTALLLHLVGSGLVEAPRYRVSRRIVKRIGRETGLPKMLAAARRRTRRQS